MEVIFDGVTGNPEVIGRTPDSGWPTIRPECVGENATSTCGALYS